MGEITMKEDSAAVPVSLILFCEATHVRYG